MIKNRLFFGKDIFNIICMEMSLVYFIENDFSINSLQTPYLFRADKLVSDNPVRAFRK